MLRWCVFSKTFFYVADPVSFHIYIVSKAQGRCEELWLVRNLVSLEERYRKFG